jgi:hypothetical protein
VESNNSRRKVQKSRRKESEYGGALEGEKEGGEEREVGWVKNGEF